MAITEDTGYPVPPPLHIESEVNFPGQGPDYAFMQPDYEAWYGPAYVDHLHGYTEARRQGDQEAATRYLKLMIIDKEERIRSTEARAAQAERRAWRVIEGYTVAFLLVIMGLWTATSLHFHRPVAPQEMFTVWAGPPPPLNGGPPNGNPARP